MPDSIDLVIFDCDGVLVDSEAISARVLIAALAELGVVVDLAHFSSHFVGRSFPTVAKTIREAFSVTLPDDFEAQYRARLVIEDSLPGVHAGLAAGMPVMRYIGGTHLRGRKPTDLKTPPNVTVFDKWQQFFHIMPELRKNED